MKKYILIFTSIILGLLVRIIPIWSAVFSKVGIKYNAPDSYYHARGILDAIDGNNPVLSIFEVYNHVAAAIIKVSRIDPELMIAIMPLAIFACTVPAVYLIGKALFGHKVAVISCFIFAVLPGEYLVRSLLGEPDHHAAEVLVATWALCIIMLALNARKRIIKYALLIIIAAVGAYTLNYMLPLLKGYFVFLFSGYAYMTTEVRGIFENPPAATYIIDVLVAMVLLGLVFYKSNLKNPALWAFALWTVSAVFLTVIQRRFDYYLTANLAVLCGYGVIIVAKDMKMHFAVVASFVILVSAPISYFQTQVANYRPSDEWAANLKWLSTKTDGKVLAWWDYGYWIKYYGMKPVIDGGQSDMDAVRRVATFYLTGENRPEVEYVVVDSVMVGEFIPVLESWAGIETPDKESLAERLYSGEKIDGYIYLTGENVKIFEVVE